MTLLWIAACFAVLLVADFTVFTLRLRARERALRAARLERRINELVRRYDK